MTVFEFNNVEEFKNQILSIKQDKFNLYITWKNEILVRPKSRGSYDTFYIKDLTQSQIDEILSIWPGNKFKVKQFWLDETRDFRSLAK